MTLKFKRVSRWIFPVVGSVLVISILNSCGMLPGLQPTATPTSPPSPTNTPAPLPTMTEPLPVAPTEIPSNTPPPIPTETSSPTQVQCFNLLTPENGAVLSLDSTVIFSWDAQAGAVRYQLLFILPNGQFEMNDVGGTVHERHTASIPLNGEYKWQVTAYGADDQPICVAGVFLFNKPAPTPSPTRETGFP